ncbi:MAG TPA: MFS transporter [Solirubrobacteraceae bacterium]
MNPSTTEVLYRRTLRVLLVSQVLAGAGLAAGVTVGALLAEDMLGSTGTAGVPAALLTLGSAAAATGVGRLSQRSGRRPGLALGYAVGAIGGAGVVLAAATDSVALLFASLLLYGSGTATNLQARYAGADLAAPDRRGRAVSTVLVATTLGAVIGPNLVEPTGHVAEALGIRELAGPFILATAAYGLAAVAVLVLLRPDPLLAARAAHMDPAAIAVAAEEPTAVQATATVRLAAAAMVLTQLVMVAIMTMTPIHMRDHGHSVGAAGLVISIHVAAMFLPSPLTGQLVDRIGRRPVLAASGVTLLAAGVVAATAPADSMVLLTVALALLGLGWNFGLVGGTALVTDAVPLANRARTQGSVDLAVALSGAAGGISSGVVVAGAGYATLSLAGGLLALALIPALVAEQRAASARSVPVLPGG